MNSDLSTVDKVIRALGGVTKTAAALGIKNPSAVSNWRMRDSIPYDKVLKVEQLTGISRHEMRPDIFGAMPPEVSQ